MTPRLIMMPNAEALSRRAASHIARRVREGPDCVLGLATGGTPIDCYKMLVAMHQRESLRFRHVRTFNLDEYFPITPTHRQSYTRFMREHLFSKIDIPRASTHIPRGDMAIEDVEDFCQCYEREILSAGGIDLQLLGIGRNGHLGFNEPGSSFDSRVRLVGLSAETIRDNARFFDCPDDVPQQAITMGLQTISASREILLLATGREKAASIRAALEGKVTERVPASVLQCHGNVTVMLDRTAAAELVGAGEYCRVE